MAKIKDLENKRDKIAMEIESKNIVEQVKSVQENKYLEILQLKTKTSINAAEINIL